MEGVSIIIFAQIVQNRQKKKHIVVSLANLPKGVFYDIIVYLNNFVKR